VGRLAICYTGTDMGRQKTACKPLKRRENFFELERETGFEPATSTLAKMRSLKPIPLIFKEFFKFSIKKLLSNLSISIKIVNYC
jgi:hypothetical protein